MQIWYLKMQADNLLVSATNISKSFGNEITLKQVDLTVNCGEIITLIGPNGSGKSTLMKIILGLMPPDSGKVEKKPNLKIGYVPQHIAIDQSLPMTVRRFLNLPKAHAASDLSRVSRETGIDYLLDAPLQQLSGGEFQRTLLTRALLKEPDLLVLDEPAQGVDFSGQNDMYQLIDRVSKDRNCGVLLVSHDLHMVMAATDRVICLNHHVCCSGKPEIVSRHPEFQALFGDNPLDNVALYQHHHDHSHDLAGDPVDHKH